MMMLLTWNSAQMVDGWHFSTIRCCNCGGITESARGWLLIDVDVRTGCSLVKVGAVALSGRKKRPRAELFPEGNKAFIAWAAEPSPELNRRWTKFLAVDTEPLYRLPS